jgi:prepilin peptidase CpaA
MAGGAVATAGVLVGLSVTAAIFDARSRKIPNALTAVLAVAALLLHAPYGFASVGDTLVAMVSVFLAGAVAFRAGILGGGDVKLLTGCAGMVGTHALPLLLVAVFGAGAILAVGQAVRRGRLRALLSSTAGVAAGLPAAEAMRVPYGIAIAAGCVVYSLPFFVHAALRYS